MIRPRAESARVIGRAESRSVAGGDADAAKTDSASYNRDAMLSNDKFIVEPVGLEVDRLPRPIDWRELFGNDHPVELEIGICKGTFLVGQAEAREDTNFFGIEWANKYWRSASDRLRRRGGLDARAGRGGGEYFLSGVVP